ncbi:MAG: hypothetical protein ACTTJM_09075 [Bergeyella cardium]
MKTKIKITPETLFLAHRIVRDACRCIARTREEKVRKSIFEELFKILTSRCFTYTNNPNGRELSLTLKFYQMDALFNCLIIANTSEIGFYEKNKLDMLKNKIHQLL